MIARGGVPGPDAGIGRPGACGCAEVGRERRRAEVEHRYGLDGSLRQCVWVVAILRRGAGSGARRYRSPAQPGSPVRRLRHRRSASLRAAPSATTGASTLATFSPETEELEAGNRGRLSASPQSVHDQLEGRVLGCPADGTVSEQQPESRRGSCFGLFKRSTLSACRAEGVKT
jgi:hypothetical protein